MEEPRMGQEFLSCWNWIPRINIFRIILNFSILYILTSARLSSLFPPGSIALKKWANETSEDFRFTIKIPQNLINKTITSATNLNHLEGFCRRFTSVKRKNSCNFIITASPRYHYKILDVHG